jgi:hypothetical protein
MKNLILVSVMHYIKGKQFTGRFDEYEMRLIHENFGNATSNTVFAEMTAVKIKNYFVQQEQGHLCPVQPPQPQQHRGHRRLPDYPEAGLRVRIRVSRGFIQTDRISLAVIKLWQTGSAVIPANPRESGGTLAKLWKL